MSAVGSDDNHILMVRARNQQKTDVYGLPVGRKGLGWIPGVAYRTWTGNVDEVLGYTRDGAVVVRNVATGIERTHRTPVDKTNVPQYVTALGRKLTTR